MPCLLLPRPFPSDVGGRRSSHTPPFSSFSSPPSNGRMEDELLAHPFYQTAAHGLVSCFLRVHAAKEAAKAQGEEGGEVDYAAMTPEERKRAKVGDVFVVGGCWCHGGEGRGGEAVYFKSGL